MSTAHHLSRSAYDRLKAEYDDLTTRGRIEIAQAIEAWFVKQGVRPHAAGHIDDSALLKGFAQAGLGFIAVPTSIETEVTRQYGLRVLGRAPEVRHAVYLISPRTRRPHPMVVELERSAAQR